MNGTNIVEKEEIKEAFVNYFIDLFCNCRSSDIKLNWEQLCPGERLNLSIIESPFLEDEIKAAVFSLAKDKASGVRT